MIGWQKLAVLVTAATVFSSGVIIGAMSIGNGPRASGDSGGLDYGLDTDGDGLFDYLVVVMPLVAGESDYYNVFALLSAQGALPTDCFGYGVSPGFMPPTYPISYAQVRVFMEKGDSTVKIAFKGKEINAARMDGPYLVQAWTFADSGFQGFRNEPCMMPNCGGDMMPELTPWEHTTGAYKYTDFEEATYAIEFTGSNSDAGVDVNGNGLFDLLRVTSEVDVNLAGTYQISAVIMQQINWTPEDPVRPGDDWNYLPMPLYISFWGQVALEEGIQTIDFDLPGGQIRESGVDGPYDVYLSVYYAFDNYRYPYYNESDPGYIGGGVVSPPNGIGMFPGTWTPGGDGRGFDFYYDFACHKTQAYLHDQFDEPPPDIVFTGEFSDEGVDRDANGLYEELRVGVGVEVFQPGYYMADWTLSSVDGSQAIAQESAGLYLEAGKQTVMMSFPGGAIKDSGVDGPYRVHINIIRVERPIDPEADYTTSAYAHDQFEGYGGSNNTRSLWIGSLDVRAAGEPPEILGAAAVTIVRGPDMLTVVMDGVVELVITDSNGNQVFMGRVDFSIPSGGGMAAVSFTFTLQEHGEYVATAYMTSTWSQPDRMSITFRA